MEIKIQDLTKRFGRKLILNALTYNFKEGITCVTGASGCGKTTLLRILSGLETPDAGIITGTEDKKISLVFQENRLFGNLSAVRNVLLASPRGTSAAYAEALLAQLGIGEPRKKVSEFSGGMCRRVAIARALAAEHDILLLDEPCTGLEEQLRTHVLDIIRRHETGKTVICVTHDPSDIDRLDAESLELPLLQTDTDLS